MSTEEDPYVNLPLETKAPTDTSSEVGYAGYEYISQRVVPRNTTESSSTRKKHTAPKTGITCGPWKIVVLTVVITLIVSALTGAILWILMNNKTGKLGVNKIGKE